MNKRQRIEQLTKELNRVKVQLASFRSYATGMTLADSKFVKDMGQDILNLTAPPQPLLRIPSTGGDW